MELDQADQHSYRGETVGHQTKNRSAEPLSKYSQFRQFAAIVVTEIRENGRQAFLAQSRNTIEMDRSLHTKDMGSSQKKKGHYGSFENSLDTV